jgi:glutamine synthetase
VFECNDTLILVAKQLKDFKKEVDALIESKDMKKDDAIFNVLEIKHSKKFF